jgi:hypothetical protein
MSRDQSVTYVMRLSRWRVAFGRWPNFSVQVGSNLVGERFHVNLRFVL